MYFIAAEKSQPHDDYGKQEHFVLWTVPRVVCVDTLICSKFHPIANL